MALCGTVTYNLSNTAFVSSNPPPGNQLLDPWTLSFQTNDPTLIGTRFVTLTATMTGVVGVLTTSTQFTVDILADPCTTQILATQIPDITVSKWDTNLLPLLFANFTDTYSQSQGLVSQVVYTTSSTNFQLIQAPGSAFQILPSFSTLSAGVYPETIQAHLANCPLVPPVTQLFNLVVVDECSGTTLIPTSSTQTTINYVAGSGPLAIPFMQFATDVTYMYGNVSACGQRTY